MKKLFFLLAIILPMMANAMKLVTNEIDEFTGKQTVITSWDGFDKSRNHIRFRYQNDKLFIDFKTFHDGAIVVTEGSKLMVKSSNGEIISYEAIGNFSGGKGQGAVGMVGSAAWGIEVVYSGDVAWMLENTPTLMRMYTTDGYLDKKISEKDGKKIQELAKLLLDAINK